MKYRVAMWILLQNAGYHLRRGKPVVASVVEKKSSKKEKVGAVAVAVAAPAVTPAKKGKKASA